MYGNITFILLFVGLANIGQQPALVQRADPLPEEAEKKAVAIYCDAIKMQGGLYFSADIKKDDKRTAVTPNNSSSEPPGAFVLCGGGTMPRAARERFLDLAGGAKAVIVVIPTASQAADNPSERESFLAPWRKLRPARVEWLHTRDRKEADTEAFCQCLTSATGVWFSGGDQSRLTSSYLGTRTGTELRAVLRRGGVVGGTSAGAAVMGHPMIRGGRTQADIGPGFGLLPDTIVDQHFLKRQREPRLKDALRKHPGLRGLGIDEDTAVVIHAGRLEVVGESAATIYQGPKPNGPWVEQLIKSNETAPFSLVPRRR